MGNDYFNENVLNNSSNDSVFSYTLEQCNKLEMNFVFNQENTLYLCCKIDGEKLNSYGFKSVLKLDEKEKFLTTGERDLFNYLIHRMTDTQTMYRILNDFEILFAYLKDSNITIKLDENIIEFADELMKLDMELNLNEQCNVVLKVGTNGKFIFGKNVTYFFNDNKIKRLSESINIEFYKEISKLHNTFSVDAFFALQKNYIDKLKENHNLKIAEEVENLSGLNIETKVAPLVLEVDKTANFIVVELKYKIGDETFRIEDYKYVDNASWMNKTDLIKIVKEEGKLIKYTSDLDLGEDLLDQIFQGSRIMYRRYMKVPFRIMLPTFQLNNFVDKVIPQAEKFVEVDYKQGEKLNLTNGKIEFDLNCDLDLKSDLLEFAVRFKIEDEYFDLEFIKELMLKNRKYVQLKSGKTINVENIRDISKWIEFLKLFDFNYSKRVYKAPSASVLELDNFLADFEKKYINSNSNYKNLLKEMKEKKPLISIPLPPVVEEILRNYQKEGVYWMHFLKKYKFGGILADEMGLGKTLQALTILAMEEGGQSIVICPKSLLYNWENEVAKYFPSKKVLVVDGDLEKRKKLIKKVPEHDIVVTSYSMLQKDYIEYIEKDFEFNYAILDEAHYVKNIKTLSAKAVRLINTKNRILLTGTPIENNLSELYAAFDLILPGYLGTKSEFSKDFISKVERNNLIALEILQAKIRPFILRRTKKEVLKELPDKQEQIVYSEMTNKQVGVYSEVLRRLKEEVNELVAVKGFERSRIQILSALLKLRQVCNHPSLIDESFVGEEDISGKFEQYKTILKEVISGGEKVLVFSQFTSMLDIMEKDLEKDGIKYVRLDGSSKNRQELVDQFNNDEKMQVFLISLKAGGVGLNLTSATNVFLYDPWWNPMVEKQAQDRAHRIGQKKTVNVYKFITKNSIEEKILKLQERKGNLFDNLVVSDDGFVKRLEWEDLMDLFE